MKPEPRYKIGQAVRVEFECAEVRCRNRDFAVILDVQDLSPQLGLPITQWYYRLHNEVDEKYAHQAVLRPIPPEEHNGIDAKDYINKLCSVEVE